MRRATTMRSFMTLMLVQVLYLAVLAASIVGDDESLYRLPDGFLVGAGTSAFQVEGAWDADGKGATVMDHAFHAIGYHYGDTACDFYHRFRDDIALAASLKLNAFRLSISWARIFPNGRADHVNAKGVQFYHDVLDELLKYNISPVVTISHLDHPQALEDAFGGWLSEKMVDAFAAYADFVFREYGSKVKYWLTLNEVNVHCMAVYGHGPSASVFLPPGNKTLSSIANRQLCIHHEILAHSAAYRIYRDRYKEAQRGLVGVGILPPTARANSAALEDVQAAERENLIQIGYILYPLVYGDYPAVFKARATDTPLPEFTDDQRTLLRGTVDFAGFNAYVGMNVSSTQPGFLDLLEQPDGPLLSWLNGPGSSTRQEQPGPGGGFLDAYWVLGGLALWMNANFGDRVKVFITENGELPPLGQTAWPEDVGVFDRETRGVSSSKYLRDLIYTINKNNLTNVMGYISWSFLDEVEFDQGLAYTGMVHVDFAGGSLNRTLKESAQFFKEMMTTRVVPQIEPTPKASHAAGSPVAACGCWTAVLLGIAHLLTSNAFR